MCGGDGGGRIVSAAECGERNEALERTRASRGEWRWMEKMGKELLDCQEVARCRLRLPVLYGLLCCQTMVYSTTLRLSMTKPVPASRRPTSNRDQVKLNGKSKSDRVQSMCVCGIVNCGVQRAALQPWFYRSPSTLPVTAVKE